MGFWRTNTGHVGSDSRTLAMWAVTREHWPCGQWLTNTGHVGSDSRTLAMWAVTHEHWPCGQWLANTGRVGRVNVSENFNVCILIKEFFCNFGNLLTFRYLMKLCKFGWIFFVLHIYPPITRKRSMRYTSSLKSCRPSVYHTKMGESR